MRIKIMMHINTAWPCRYNYQWKSIFSIWHHLYMQDQVIETPQCYNVIPSDIFMVTNTNLFKTLLGLVVDLQYCNVCIINFASFRTT